MENHGCPSFELFPIFSFGSEVKFLEKWIVLSSSLLCSFICEIHEEMNITGVSDVVIGSTIGNVFPVGDVTLMIRIISRGKLQRFNRDVADNLDGWLFFKMKLSLLTVCGIVCEPGKYSCRA